MENETIIVFIMVVYCLIIFAIYKWNDAEEQRMDKLYQDLKKDQAHEGRVQKVDF